MITLFTKHSLFFIVSFILIILKASIWMPLGWLLNQSEPVPSPAQQWWQYWAHEVAERTKVSERAGGHRVWLGKGDLRGAVAESPGKGQSEFGQHRDPTIESCCLSGYGVTAQKQKRWTVRIQPRDIIGRHLSKMILSILVGLKYSRNDTANIGHT